MGIRVVVAEDDYLVRQGIERSLATHDDVELIALCGDADGLRELVHDHDPDVVVTDIRMPPTHTDEGIRIALDLAVDRPSTGVVVLSQFDEPEYVLALLEGGSTGRSYLLKERVADAGQLVAAVRAVASGGSIIDPQVVERLVAARSGARSPLEWLTPRERDVLAAMARGMSNAGIADDLGIGLRAVEKHISSIFTKLHLSPDEETVHRRVQAVLTFLSEV